MNYLNDMETGKLELKDIAGYLPYELSFTSGDNPGFIHKALQLSLDSVFGKYKPILRPISDLHKPVAHNGKGIIPVLELAKIARPELDWGLIGYTAHYKDEITFLYVEDVFILYSRFTGHRPIPNQRQLFDYMDELKLDYRGLIDAGLAISVYDLEANNPYK